MCFQTIFCRFHNNQACKISYILVVFVTFILHDGHISKLLAFFICLDFHFMKFLKILTMTLDIIRILGTFAPLSQLQNFSVLRM